MNKGVKIGLISALVLASAYAYNQFRYIKNLCYSFVGLKIKNLSLSDLTFSLKLNIKNLDNLSVHVKRVQIDVYANNRFIADIDDFKGFLVEPNSSTSTDLNISLNPKQFISDVSVLLSSSSYKNIKLSFKGKVVVKKFGINFVIPIRFTDTIANLSSGSGDSNC